MKQQGKEVSNVSIYENYIRPLTKQGVINSDRSILNGKENLYYPVNSENEHDASILPLTDDCRLIVNNSFDEKKILEESFRRLLERRSNGGGVKYKIIDIDGSDLDIDGLLERYFFSETHHTSCSVIFTEFHNNSIQQYSTIDKEQTNDISHPENEISDKKDNVNNDLTENASRDLSCLYQCYYCKEFAPTDDRDTYERHVILSHDGKLAYPSLVDLEKHSLKRQGKSWEL